MAKILRQFLAKRSQRKIQKRRLNKTTINCTGITDTLAVIRGGVRDTLEERTGLALYFPDLDRGWKKDSMPDLRM
jgi:hypothetical protein